MNSLIVNRLPRIEGILKVVRELGEVEKSVFLESGRSVHLEGKLKGRYPLEAIQLTQTLSAKTCVAHGIAATSALENYLQLDPTAAALQIRQVMLQLSAIYAHLSHFYVELLPDYLNKDHFAGLPEAENLLVGLLPERPKKGDLPAGSGKKILKHLPQAAKCLDHLQKVMALIGGKFPVVMNFVPGGVTNFSIDRELLMHLVRRLEQIKPFVEVTWPQDVKDFIIDLPETTRVYEKKANLISFGSQPSGSLKERNAVYSEGIWINGKLEPVNDLMITETFQNTFYLPLDKAMAQAGKLYDFKKTGARTWIKGARYDGETAVSGALARMMVTHFGGGNLEISDRVGQMIDDLGLSMESPNCVASRILSEIFESRMYLKSVLSILLEFDFKEPINRQTDFDFFSIGAGTGMVEAPNGSLLHQVFIGDNRITQYRIVSATNWNFSTADDEGRSGIVEQELNVIHAAGDITPVQASRLIHSYNAQILDGTQ